MNRPIGQGNERLCTCGHNIWDHEDAEGGTHECTHRGCDCPQFKDADDDRSVIDTEVPK